MPPQESQEPDQAEATEGIRTRMRRGLVQAMKARDQQAVAALRSTLAAIDNAEAVDAAAVHSDAADARAVNAGAGDAGAGDAGAGDAGAGDAGAGDAGQDSPTGDGHAPIAGTGHGVGPGWGAGHPAVAGSVLGLGAAEVERRTLTPQEMAAIVRAEVTDRETAAHDYDRAGRPDEAERLRAQAKLLTTYLDPPGSEAPDPHDG